MEHLLSIAKKYFKNAYKLWNSFIFNKCSILSFWSILNINFFWNIIFGIINCGLPTQIWGDCIPEFGITRSEPHSTVFYRAKEFS